MVDPLTILSLCSGLGQLDEGLRSALRGIDSIESLQRCLDCWSGIPALVEHLSMDVFADEFRRLTQNTDA